MTTISSAATLAKAGQTGVANVQCPAGSFVAGGGYNVVDVGQFSSVYPSPLISRPYLNGWVVQIANKLPGSADSYFTAYAICAS